MTGEKKLICTGLIVSVFLGFSAVIAMIFLVGDNRFKVMCSIIIFTIFVLFVFYIVKLNTTLNITNKKLEILKECLECSKHGVFKNINEVYVASSKSRNPITVVETESEYSETVKYICRSINEI